ncbi:MAG: hypothetical protein GWP14_01480 [Actinobacteria bacterium]|nr:hypothetical protein [Actinomycetota bacterium]
MTKVSKAELGPPQKHRTGQRSRLALVGLCVYWPTIFIISHIPKDYVPKNVTVSGVGVHLGAYFVLTLLVFLNAGLGHNTHLRSKKTWLLVGAIAAYAALDEFVQSFIQGRSGNIIDWTVDMSACLLCVGLLRLLTGIRQGRG